MNGGKNGGVYLLKLLGRPVWLEKADHTAGCTCLSCPASACVAAAVLLVAAYDALIRMDTELTDGGGARDSAHMTRLPVRRSHCQPWDCI